MNISKTSTHVGSCNTIGGTQRFSQHYDLNDGENIIDPNADTHIADRTVDTQTGAH